MAARTKRLIAAVALLACGASLYASAGGPQGSAPQPGAATRIISLVPALTEMLFAIGAGPQVVAVSSYDDFPPQATVLPRVGALLDPDVERILMLRPDLVLTYGSQGSLETQLQRAGIKTFSYRHGGIQALLTTIRELGTVTGRPAAGDAKAREIAAQLEAVGRRVQGRARPRVLLVFGRQPQSLQQVYVSGGAGFLHEMLEIAGGANVFADIPRESVQPSHETLIARAPEVILELRATHLVPPADAARERAIWSSLASIPAVRNGRIQFLNGDYLVVPGPRVAIAVEAFARALHPEAFK